MLKLPENTYFEKITKIEKQENKADSSDNDFVAITKQVDRDIINLVEQLETLKELENLIN